MARWWEWLFGRKTRKPPTSVTPKPVPTYVPTPPAVPEEEPVPYPLPAYTPLPAPPLTGGAVAPPPPAFTLISVAPTSVTTAGGEAMTVTGTGFTALTGNVGGAAITPSVVNATTATFTMPATSAGVKDLAITQAGVTLVLSGAINVAAAANNEPAGFTRIYQLAPATPNSPVDGVNNGSFTQTNVNVVGGNVRITFPAGLESGAQNMSGIDLLESGTLATSPEWKRWYTRIGFRMPDADFVSQNVGTKLLYFVYGTRGQNNQSTILIRGPENGSNDTPKTSYEVYGQFSRDLSGASVPMYQNVTGHVNQNPAPLTCGVFHTIETLCDVGTADNYNASFRAWVNDVLVCDYSATAPYAWPSDHWGGWQNNDGSSKIQMLDSTSGFTLKFIGIHWDTIWGGSGATPLNKVRSDHFDFNELYLSVAA